MISRNTMYAALLIASIVNAACSGIPPELNKENKNMNDEQSWLAYDAVECGSDENVQVGSFTVYDYAVVIGMLVISLGIGK